MSGEVIYRASDLFCTPRLRCVSRLFVKRFVTNLASVVRRNRSKSSSGGLGIGTSYSPVLLVSCCFIPCLLRIFPIRYSLSCREGAISVPIEEKSIFKQKKGAETVSHTVFSTFWCSSHCVEQAKNSARIAQFYLLSKPARL